MRCAIFGHKRGLVNSVKLERYARYDMWTIELPGGGYIEFKAWCTRCGALFRGTEDVSGLALRVINELPKPDPEKHTIAQGEAR